jgi:hypothetical protein
VVLQSFSSVANFPNDDFHWQGELPGTQALVQGVFRDHDVAFLCGFGAQAQITVFKYSDGPLIPPQVRQIYLTNNTWDIGKNYYGEVAILGDVKATLPILNARLAENPPAGAALRNKHLRLLDEQRRGQWDAYLARALQAPEIWAVVIAEALRATIRERGLQKQFVYVHEAVSRLWAPWNDADTFRRAQRQHLPLLLAIEQVDEVLHADETGPAVAFGDAEGAGELTLARTRRMPLSSTAFRNTSPHRMRPLQEK